jgi:hypothetical protein
VLTNLFLKSSFDALLKLQEVTHTTFVTALAHTRIETPSCEGQVGIYLGTVEPTSKCPLARPPTRAVGKVVRVSNQDVPSISTLTTLSGDLRPIRDRANILYDRIATEGYVQNDGDIVAVSGLTEDLRDLLFEHRVSTNP